LVTVIRENTFESCFKLENIIMSNNLNTIGDYAFYRCFNLKSIRLGDNVGTIGKWGFAYTGLTNITIPNLVKSIGQYAFVETIYLTNVILGDNITYLFSNTFGQINTNYQLDITLKSINVNDNIKITPGTTGYYNNAILKNDLIVKKRSNIGLKIYNCQTAINISEAIEYTNQSCAEITIAPTLSPENSDKSFILEIVLIVITYILLLISIFLIYHIFK
jgi:hypothetical protein